MAHNKNRDGRSTGSLVGTAAYSAPVDASTGARQASGSRRRSEMGVAGHAQFAASMAAARQAISQRTTEREDGRVLVNPIIPNFAGRTASLDLRAVVPNEPAPFDLGILGLPVERPVAEQMTLSGLAAAASRVVAAGAVLVPIAEPKTRVQSGTIMFEEVPGGLTITDAAAFGPGTAIGSEGEADADLSPLPWSSADIDRETLSDVSWRCEIGRREQKSRSDEETAGLFMRAIALGLGRAIDRELTSAILALAPGSWTLGAAAEKGLEHDQLRAIVGTEGAGASGVAPDGSGLLVAGTVPGELTDVMAETVVGAFGRMGVAVEPEVTILFERLDRSGKLIVTARASLQVLIPDSGCAWVLS